MQFAPLYPLLYSVLSATFPDCFWVGSPDSPTIALTFDDGPHPQYTPQLLRVLERYQIPASFFWLGACVEQAPTVAQAVCDQGHFIGLHGYDHRSFPCLSADELRQSLEQTRAAIGQSCSRVPQSLNYVRPPNGFFTPRTLKLLRQWQYEPVMWTVVPEDWVRPGVAVVLQRIMHQVRNGAIIVLHDGYCGGIDVAETVDRLAPLLLEQGYQFVTLPNLREIREKPL